MWWWFKTPEKTCSICSETFSLSRNPSGLVFEDTHFVCENCCEKYSKEELNSLEQTIMRDPFSTTGMPIALWLIHEQNKDKEMMTIKK